MTSKNANNTLKVPQEEQKIRSKKSSEKKITIRNKDSNQSFQMSAFSNDAEYVIKEKYKLSNYCKGGAFGEVFFAKHIDKNYDVAIKFVNTLRFPIISNLE